MPVLADGPTPYPDPKDDAAWPGKGPIRYFAWMKDNRQYFWTQLEKDQGAIVFLGDSLTMSWPAPLLKESFPGVKIANRGIGGDTTRGILFRLQEDVLDLHPRAVMLLAGFNDIGAHGNPSLAIENLTVILDKIKAQYPAIPIILVKGPPSAYAPYPLEPGARAKLN